MLMWERVPKADIRHCASTGECRSWNTSEMCIRDRVNEVRAGRFQGELQGLVVHSLDAHILCICSSVVKFFCVYHIIRDHVHILTSGCGCQDTQCGIYIVVGGEVAAIAPFQAVS